MPSPKQQSQSRLVDLFDLRERNILIIGGAGYLGFQISLALAECGARVFICSRDFKKCQDATKVLNKLYPNKHLPFKVNIASTKSIDSLFKKISKITNSKIHSLVNCGWSGKKNTFETINEQDWDQDIEISITGVFKTVKSFVPMLENTKGNILNVSSMYGLVAPDYRLYDSSDLANPPSYGAAKAGVIQLTKYLASFLAPKEIRVNCISPGPFPFVSTQKSNSKFINKLSKKTMLNRIGYPHEIKGICAVLCSDAGSYITGQNFSIDGGWTSW